MIARASGVSIENGVPNPEQAAVALKDTVVVSIDIDR
jgi:hypothetical protein